MFPKKYIFVVLILIIAVAVIVLSNSNKKKNQQIVNQLPDIQTPTAQVSPTPEETPTPSAKVSSAPAVSGGITRGQVVCDYQIPATTNSFGDAKLESNWDNLIAGKGRNYKLAVCVSVNGNNTLMLVNTQSNGSIDK